MRIGRGGQLGREEREAEQLEETRDRSMKNPAQEGVGRKEVEMDMNKESGGEWRGVTQQGEVGIQVHPLTRESQNVGGNRLQKKTWVGP